jgi:hypothetical protein
MRSGQFNPVLTIIGKDLDVAGTFNSDVKPGEGGGFLPAGRFMKYVAGDHFEDGAGAGGADIFGVLAQEVDTSGTEPVAAMVYRRGTFLRQEVETANEKLIPPGQALDLALKDKGILLEWSYTDYLGIPNPPAGAPSPVVG